MTILRRLLDRFLHFWMFQQVQNVYFPFFNFRTLLTWILRQPESGWRDNKSNIEHTVILRILIRFLFFYILSERCGTSHAAFLQTSRWNHPTSIQLRVQPNLIPTRRQYSIAIFSLKYQLHTRNKKYGHRCRDSGSVKVRIYHPTSIRVSDRVFEANNWIQWLLSRKCQSGRPLNAFHFTNKTRFHCGRSEGHPRYLGGFRLSWHDEITEAWTGLILWYHLKIHIGRLAIRV